MIIQSEEICRLSCMRQAVFLISDTEFIHEMNAQSETLLRRRILVTRERRGAFFMFCPVFC